MDLGIGDWGLGIGPNPQSPIPNPQYNKQNIQIFHYLQSNIIITIQYLINNF